MPGDDTTKTFAIKSPLRRTRNRKHINGNITRKPPHGRLKKRLTRRGVEARRRSQGVAGGPPTRSHQMPLGAHLPSHHLEQNPSCCKYGCNSDAETDERRVDEAAAGHNCQKRRPLSHVILPQHSIVTMITMSKRMMIGGRAPRQTNGRQRTIPKKAVARSSSSWMNMVLVLTKTDHAWAGGGRRLASYLIGSPNTTHQKVSLPSGVQATPIPISL